MHGSSQKVLPFGYRAEWHALFSDIQAEKDSGHINALKFKGILLLLNEPSTKPPNGSRGHRILIPTDVAKKNLHTLVNMGVDYEDSFDKHNPKKKVGVISKAWIDGNKLMCSGIIWKKDFPDVKNALKDKQLGMSFEGSNIMVEDPKADVWKITEVCFTGAAILYKTAAAYQKTEALAAAADSRAMCAELVYITNGGKAMSKPVKKVKTHQSSRRHVSAAGENQADLIAKSLQKVLKPFFGGMQSTMAAQTTAINGLSASIEEFQDEQIKMLATGAPGMLGKRKKAADPSSSSSESESKDSEAASAASSSAAASAASSSASSGGKKVKAAKDKKRKIHADEDSAAASAASSSAAAASASSSASSSQKGGASSAASDSSSLEDMDESNSVGSSSSQAPGHFNKNANDNKGRKQTVTTGGEKHPKAKLGVKASKELRSTVRTLIAQKEEDQALIAKLQRKLKKQKELSASYDNQERRSRPHISATLSGLLDKSAVDVSVLANSNEKMTLAEFDAILDKAPSLGTVEKMAMKAEATKVGILETGEIVRQ